MNNISVWIKHLRHPLVFAGFGLFVFALIIKPLFLNITNLSGAGTEELLRQAMLLLFLLAAMAVVGGILLSRRNSGADNCVARQDSGGKPAGAMIEQETKGVKSPAVNSGGDARLNYGGAAYGPNKPAKKTDVGVQKRQPAPAQVKQATQREKSPAVHAQGNVEISYDE